MCVRVCGVQKLIGRTTRPSFMTDSSLDIKCPRDETSIDVIDFFSKIDIDFRSINVLIFVEIANIGMLHIILDRFWVLPEYESSIIFLNIDMDRSIYRFSIDRCIDFQSIDLSIFQILWNIGMLHIILDPFLCPEYKSIIFFGKSIMTDRYISFPSINDFFMDFQLYRVLLAIPWSSISWAIYRFWIRIWHPFFENKYRSVDFRSIYVLIFEFFSNMGNSSTRTRRAKRAFTPLGKAISTSRTKVRPSRLARATFDCKTYLGFYWGNFNIYFFVSAQNLKIFSSSAFLGRSDVNLITQLTQSHF